MKLMVGVKVSNSLSLTPQLQQAIRLLQLSSLELEQEVQLQLESNPLLEQVEEIQEAQAAVVSLPEQTDLTQQLNADHLPEELPVDTQWDDIYTHHATNVSADDYEERGDNRHIQTTLKEHLIEQINLLNFSTVDRLIAHCIVDSLDNKGFLACDIGEITTSVNHLLNTMNYDELVEDDEVTVVLKYVQRLDPIGVASRNLVECLLVQLESLPETVADQHHAKKLLQHYQLLITNDLPKLLKQTGLNMSELKQAMACLRTLKSSPAAEFESKETDYQIPDVVVSKKNHQWFVQLNPDVMPKLRVNSFYANMIRRADQSDDNQYLRNQMLEAKNFIKGIDERHKTLLKVATCIVEHQRQFFEVGVEGMKPLILKDIAEEVGLHESTISRVTTNKYMLTPRGLYELKYFFSSHVATSSGGEASSTAIRAKIKKMIAEENIAKPLSDNTICNLLKNEGIDVARRTVAKYRESLNIPSSSERKVLI